MKSKEISYRIINKRGNKKSKIERLEQKINELDRWRRQVKIKENLKMREMWKEHRDRIRRLIQYGLITIQYLNLNDKIEPAEFEQIIRKALGIQPAE